MSRINPVAVGQVFGKLTVLESNGAKTTCVCECGTSITTVAGKLRKGGQRTCGQKKCWAVGSRPRIDLVGKVYGTLTVIERVGYNEKHHTFYWLCRCQCGIEKEIAGNNLAKGVVQSCGASLCRPELPQRPIEDMSGQVYGMLTVTTFSHSDPLNSMSYWNCICSGCGKEKPVRRNHLLDLSTKSCGECGENTRNLQHGECTRETQTSLHGIWGGMLDRTRNHNNHQAHRYIDRGITLFPEWNNFTTFQHWAYDNGFEEGKDLSIERIDVNKGYNPDNCKWIPMWQQAHNKENTRRIVYHGWNVVPCRLYAQAKRESRKDLVKYSTFLTRIFKQKNINDSLYGELRTTKKTKTKTEVYS